jgi:hypothetical protein
MYRKIKYVENECFTSTFFWIHNTNTRNTKEKYTNKTKTTIEQDKKTGKD